MQLLGLAGDLYGDEQRRAVRAGVDASERCDVVVVASVADRHMAVTDVDEIGRVESAP